jgi:hypothetical protein
MRQCESVDRRRLYCAHRIMNEANSFTNTGKVVIRVGLFPKTGCYIRVCFFRKDFLPGFIQMTTDLC